MHQGQEKEVPLCNGAKTSTTQRGEQRDTRIRTRNSKERRTEKHPRPIELLHFKLAGHKKENGLSPSPIDQKKSKRAVSSTKVGSRGAYFKGERVGEKIHPSTERGGPTREGPAERKWEREPALVGITYLKDRGTCLNESPKNNGPSKRTTHVTTAKGAKNIEGEKGGQRMRKEL